MRPRQSHALFTTWQASNGRDVAGGLGALSRALRMMLQSAVLALGAYLVLGQEATAGIIIAGAILTGRALEPLDLAIPNWKNWTAARQSWQRLKHVLEIGSDSGTLMPLRSPGQQLALEMAASRRRAAPSSSWLGFGSGHLNRRSIACRLFRLSSPGRIGLRRGLFL